MDSGTKKKIMVVDDETDFSFAMEYWLKSKGYEVKTAPDGYKALDLMNEFKPDLIFLDLNMPGIDGVETLKRIRQVDKEVPVIVISAFVEDKKADEAAQYNTSGVFSKDKDFEEGLFLVETALRRHKRLKEE